MLMMPASSLKLLLPLLVLAQVRVGCCRAGHDPTCCDLLAALEEQDAAELVAAGQKAPHAAEQHAASVSVLEAAVVSSLVVAADLPAVTNLAVAARADVAGAVGTQGTAAALPADG